MHLLCSERAELCMLRDLKIASLMKKVKPLFLTLKVIKQPVVPVFQHLIAFIAMVVCFALPGGWAQEYTPAVVGFYNVENLFDVYDSEGIRDVEWTPEGPKRWNEERYQEKLRRLAKVMGEMGHDIHPLGCQIIGLAEIENRQVVQDLIDTAPLNERGYDIVHYDSPDRRGIDVGLIYQPEFYKVFNHKSYTLKIPGKDNFFTRDQLLVSGVFDNDTVHVIVAHWPSRRGGEKRSLPMRMEAAELGRHIVDSLLTENPNSKIMYMGDLNDDPVNPSVRRGLRSTGDIKKATDGVFFNPMEGLFDKGIGSLAWRDSWNLFDQIILSPGLVKEAQEGYRFFGARVFNKPYLRQAEGRFAGYPFRTYVGDTYREGYSDHFPVYVILVKPVGN